MGLHHIDSREQFSCNIAQTPNELKQAFSLVYKEYFRAGYVKKATSSKMLMSTYSLLPNTIVWIVKFNYIVVSTLTQVFDSSLRLPLDEVYEKELDELRLEGRRMVEISSLAISSKYRWRNAYMPLFRNMLRHVLSCEVTDLCIAVNPKHRTFYKEILLFEDIGEKKYYPKVNAPSVALRLDLTTAEKRFEQVYGRMKPESNLHHYFFRCNGIENPQGKKIQLKKRTDTKSFKNYFPIKSNTSKFEE